VGQQLNTPMSVFFDELTCAIIRFHFGVAARYRQDYIDDESMLYFEWENKAWASVADLGDSVAVGFSSHIDSPGRQVFELSTPGSFDMVREFISGVIFKDRLNNLED
jgi:hypothetical protein